MRSLDPHARRAAAPELDSATLQRCRAGDPIAFRLLVGRYQQSVFALLSRILGHGPLVEDLAQETFLRTFRSIAGFDPAGPARLSTWILTIATRLALDARKKKSPVLRDDPDDEEDASPAFSSSIGSPEQAASRGELRVAIARAVEALPDDQRAAFLLAELHGFRMGEIAEALGVPESTAKTRLFRAREKLARALSEFSEQKEAL